MDILQPTGRRRVATPMSSLQEITVADLTSTEQHYQFLAGRSLPAESVKEKVRFHLPLVRKNSFLDERSG